MANVVSSLFFSFLFLIFLYCPPIVADLAVNQHIDELVYLAMEGNNEKFLDHVKEKELLNKTDQDGHSPLFAAMFGSPGLVDELLQQGAPLEQKDNLGFTPLISAALLGYPQVTNKLLDKGANIEARNKEGQTALMISVLGHAANQADMSAAGDNRWHNRWEQVVSALLNRGADVNVIDNRGASPLFVAIFSQDYLLCRVLIEAGADINHKLPSGVSMLRFAKIGSSQEVVDLLITNGAQM